MSEAEEPKSTRWWGKSRLGIAVRVAFVILLLANVGYLAAEMMRPEPPKSAPPPLPNTVARLILLSEKQGVLDEEASRLDTVPNAVCYSLGPFPSPNDMGAALDLVAPLADATRERRLTSATQEGYAVFLQPQASRAEALALAQELTASGIRDYYVITAGGDENGISLGLYRDEVNAQRRQRELAQAGFDARFAARRTTFPVYWLDYAELPDRRAPWETLLNDFPDLTRSSIPCF